tara:strand:+ start:1155 stop:2081 length:927 start_codon:yes stop_codon:yes gene_type:complete
MGINIIQFTIGCILLYYSAEFLVKGSRRLAMKFNISPIMIGITIVALGTSLPELVVSILANIRQQQDMVIGNVIGSNIANIGLVLGSTALISEIKFSFSKVRYDFYFFLVISFLPVIFIFSGGLFLWQGFSFIFILILYVFFLINYDRIDGNHEQSSIFNIKKITLQIIFGIIGLGIGATFFIKGATDIAIYLGVSDLIIGMSIVALGTSLPELVTSLVSVKQGENEFVLGNVIGSNIMNIVFVLGIALLFGDMNISFDEIFVHSIFLILLSLSMFIMIKLKNGINKLSGLLLIFCYVIFVYFNFYYG